MKEIDLVYCPRCDREVRVAPSDSGHQEGAHANLPDTRYVCLDYDEGCEGGGRGQDGDRCPIFGVRPVVMGIERARAGLTPEPRDMIRGRCQGCEQMTSQERVGTGYSVCGICGATNVLE